MTTSGRFTMLLLLCASFQGGNAEKPLMRQRSDVVPVPVPSDVTQPKTSNQDPVPSGPVTVSADGTLAETPLDTPLAMMSASALLHKVQEMAGSGAEAAPMDQIDEIKRLIDEELIPDLQGLHATAAAAIPTSLDAIVACNTEKDTSRATISTSTEVSVTSARTNHSTCRTNQAGVSTGHCTTLNTFLADVTAPSTVPSTPAEKITWVTDLAASNMCKYSEIRDKYAACETQTSAAGTLATSCHQKQELFESLFCTWETELVVICNQQTVCRTGAVAAYNTLVTQTQAQVVTFKAEWSALQQVRCIIMIWKTAGVDATDYAACTDLVPDTSSMDITYGAAAANTECSLTSVANPPGDAAFITSEYAASPFLGLVQDPIACAALPPAASSLLEEAKSLVQQHAYPKMTLMQLMTKAQSYYNVSYIHEGLTELEDEHVKPKLIAMILAKEETQAQRR